MGQTKSGTYDGAGERAVNVVLFAWCPSSTRYLDAFVAAGCKVNVVTAPGTLLTRWAAWQSREGVAIEESHDANAIDLVERVRRFDPALIAVAGWPQKMHSPLRSTARLGCVNLHPSLLPHYRGKHPLFWAILRDERKMGITLHHLTENIDAGPILSQRIVSVAPDATSESLAAELDEAGALLIPELIGWVRAGGLPEGRIAEEPGSYFPPVRDEHGLLDFTHSASALERLVRACQGITPAYCFWRGMKLIARRACAVELAEMASPGTIVAHDDAGIMIATSASALLVERWLFMGREHDARQLAQRLGLVSGERLSANEALDKAGF
jgi:methionyl-tRNA formyltransferase